MVNIIYNEEQIFLIIMVVTWLLFIVINLKDIQKKIANKFNGIILVFFTAPLFLYLLHNSYLQGLLYGYFYSFGVIFSCVYIMLLKYIMPIDNEDTSE